MNVRVLRAFIDLKEDKTREVGDVFQVTRERFKEINRLDKLVEEIKQPKKENDK